MIILGFRARLLLGTRSLWELIGSIAKQPQQSNNQIMVLACCTLGTAHWDARTTCKEAGLASMYET